MNRCILAFLMVFSYSVQGQQIDHLDLDDEQIVQVQENYFVPIDENEKTISFTRWCALIATAGFFFDATSFKNGKIIFTPTSTTLKWIGKCCNLAVFLLDFLQF